MAFSIDIAAAAEAVTDDDLRRVLSKMVGSAEQNAWDSISEEDRAFVANGCNDVAEYESLFAATLDGLRGNDYTDADEAHLAELADAWIEAYPEAAQLNQ